METQGRLQTFMDFIQIQEYLKDSTKLQRVPTVLLYNSRISLIIVLPPLLPSFTVLAEPLPVTHTIMELCIELVNGIKSPNTMLGDLMEGEREQVH